MHRLRKWSDPRRSQVSDTLRSSATSQPPESAPALPLTSDFRTSLILPDLSRRFTLLRSSTGDPVPLDDLRSRFEEQRARGGENQISEEEEDMLLATLERLRAKASMSTSSSTTSTGGDSGYRASTRSSDTTTDSMASSRTSSKRYSNNLFGSGRFRDYTYVRSVAQQQRQGSGRSALSISTASPSGSPHKGYMGTLSEGESSSTTQGLEDHREETATATLQRTLSRSLNRDHMRRASMALDEVIREIEEAEGVDGSGDDEVLVPRSPVDGRVRSQVPASVSGSGSSSSGYETGTAFSADHPVADTDAARSTPSPYARSANTSPTPRLPGYIPGMPRPMTPRDFGFESDDASPSNSTTPRATSPRLPGSDRTSPVPFGAASTLLRRESGSTARQGSPLTSSSQYSARNNGRYTPESVTRNASSNGRYTPDNSLKNVNGSGRQTPESRSHNGDESFMDFGPSLDSSILGRRRPASPILPNTYQPMTVPSRPSTPSNVTWKMPPASPQSVSGHSRNGSLVSSSESGGHTRARSGSNSQFSHGRNDSAVSTDSFALDRSMSTTSNVARSLRSPPLPDSPFVDAGNSRVPSTVVQSDGRPPSAMSGVELGSPLAFTSRTLRSPTPTQCLPSSSPVFPEFDRSPGSRTNSRAGQRVSRQAASSSFSLNQSYPLLLSPIANSSRSSLESAGSSYHSWDAEHKQDRTVALFSALEPQQPAWHDLLSTDKSSSSASGGDAEEVVQQYAGLSKADFAAIQDRLVLAAQVKSEATETRDRNNSIRRRRPSTSQSMHSNNGRESGPAELVAPATPSRATQGNVSKASALLESVLDSIASPRDGGPLGPSGDLALRTRTDSELSSPTRRRRAALADALFGSTEFESTFEVTDSLAQLSQPDQLAHPAQESLPAPVVPTSEVVPEGDRKTRHTSDVTSHTRLGTSNLPSQSLLPYSPSASTPAFSQGDDSELAREIQRRAEAAMAALKKIPSNSKLNENVNPMPKKKITPSQISSPRLVSASTSVDTIPLRPTSSEAQNPSKLGSRFKKLRGTLRAKPMPTGEEVTPYTLAMPTTAFPQTANYDHAFLSPLPAPPATASGLESDRFNVSVSTPPASAGPGLKGFMSRFRKNRSSEASDNDRRRHPQVSALVPNPSSSSQLHISVGQVRSAPADNIFFRGLSTQTPPTESTSPPPSAPAGGTRTFETSQPSRPNTDEAALRQLFDAASNLGLDQAALNDLLARSPSLSTRSTGARPSKHASAATSLSPSWVESTRDNPTPSRAVSPNISISRPSIEQKSTAAAANLEPTHKLSVRRQIRKSTVPENSRNTIVRRTLIIPSEARPSLAPEPSLPSRKTSTRRRRSASAASVHSLHDRAPTPPPPRSPTGRRFSIDSSPPMPEVPSSLMAHAHAAATLMPPSPLPLEKSNSTYDSLYDMYTNDSKPTVLTPPAEGVFPDGLGMDALNNLEPGSAVEVLEMANGETIWSIVNGLRDDDTESFYGNRSSFVSEYSLRDSSDGVQLFFKEHGRKSSKDSASSFLSRRKTHQGGQGGSKRPETKVFFSSSAQIGRLIDNLSQGTDSGSFNVVPTSSHTATSYHSESSAHWTVEERLEHMLGSMNGSS
ncbi:hypothetical protein OF83DRAFT_34164 [Amylostereum chailletii]|nr:hypothetical protein OF83DRAFT_34164 [Amylostereum chailletii]